MARISWQNLRNFSVGMSWSLVGCWSAGGANQSQAICSAAKVASAETRCACGGDGGGDGTRSGATARGQ